MSNLPVIIDHDQDGDVSLDPRWVHPLVAALWLWFVGAVPSWTDVSPWWLAGAAFPVTVAAAFIAHRLADEDRYGRMHAERCTAAALLASASGCGIATYHGFTGWANLTVAGLLVVWLLVWGCTYAMLLTQPRHRSTDEDASHLAAATTAEVKSYRELWYPWLRRAKLATVTIHGADKTRAGYTLLLDASTEGDDGGAQVDFGQFQSALKVLAPLASKHYARIGKVLSVNSLRAEETSYAHLWKLHVSTENALAESIPYPFGRPGVSAKDPIQPGVYEDFEPIKLSTLGVHGIMVGATNSGKSTVARTMMAEYTRQVDGMTWCAATVKLMPLVFRWLLPWFNGETDRPVINRVAGEDPREVLRMLADVYHLAHANNRGDDEDYPVATNDPALKVIIDEVTRIAEYSEKITTFDGRKFTASALLDEICSMARSAGISVQFFTQYGLIDALGDWGTRILRNVRLRVVGQTMKDYDGTSTLTGMDHVRTTQLRNYTLIIQPDAEEPRALPAKVYNLTKDDVPRVARDNTQFVPNDPQRWIDLLGDSYTDRWEPHRQATLVALCERRGIDYPTGRTGVSLPVGGDGATLPDVDIPPQIRPAATAESVKAASARFREQAANSLDLVESTNGGMGRGVPDITDLLRSPNCPPFVPAWKLAVLSGLASNDDQDAVDRETRYLVSLFSDPKTYDLPPVFDQSEPSEPGWDRRRLFTAIIGRLNALSGEDRPVPELPGNRVTTELTKDAVLAAVADRDDDSWIAVGELAVLVGHVNPDDDAETRRLDASAFTPKLNALFTLDPDTDRRRVGQSRQVRVGGLRDAVRVS